MNVVLKMSKKLLFVTLIFAYYCAQISYQADEYCYATDENRHVLFSYLTSYSNLRSLFLTPFETPESCKPIYALTFVKYGVSYMSEQEIERAKKLLQIRDQIIATNPRDKLCEADLSNLRNWNPQWDESRADHLISPGAVELVEFARRLKERTKPLFESNSKESYDFQTAPIKKSKDSAIAFVKELLGANFNDKKDEIVESELLKEISMNEAISIVEMETFIKSERIQNIFKEISTRLGFKEILPYEIILSMYELCGYENAWGADPSPAYCAAFLQDHLKAMEYIFDLKHYYELGYGNTQIENSRTLVMREILKKIIVAADGKSTKKASFYFSNGAPISAVLVKLGLYRDENQLRSDNYEAMKESRNWRSSRIDSFSTNILIVIYSCSNSEDKKVGFYHNENLLKVPFCQEKFCTLTQLKDEYKNVLKSEPQLENEKEDDKNKPLPESEKKKNDNNLQPEPENNSGGVSLLINLGLLCICALISIIVK